MTRTALDIAREDAISWRGEGERSLAASEEAFERQWSRLIHPFLKDHLDRIDFSCVLDLGAGRGRNCLKLVEFADRIIVSDVIPENVDYCKQRFEDKARFEYHYGDGATLSGIEDASVSFVYSFDSMTHFDPEVVLSYIKEFARVLRPGGFGFCHHSNYTGNPGGSFRDNPGWRNFMSRELFAHFLIRHGFVVVKQELVSWRAPELDCCSLFQLSS